MPAETYRTRPPLVVVLLAAPVLAAVLWWAFQGQQQRTAAPAPGDAVIEAVEDDERTLAFLGDSLTVGVGAATEEGFPHQTAARLDWPIAVIDGVSGSGYLAAGGGTPMPDRAQAVLRTSPDVVVVLGGNNDTWQGFAPEDVRPVALDLFRELQDGLPDGDVVVVGPFPTSFAGVEADDPMRDAVRAAAEEAGVPFLDPREMLAERLADPKAWDQYLSVDGVHPNADGYALIADALAERLPQLVG
jgi:lysophospholipase L1-like esterase